MSGPAKIPVERDPVPRRALWSWALYDCANQPFPTVIQTFVFAAYFTGEIAENETIGTSQWGRAAGIAGLIVALAGPLLGAVVDRHGRRKPWLAAFTLLCIAATAMLWFAKPDPSFAVYAAVLVCVATVGSEMAVIFYNAMLPSLVAPDRIGRWSGWGWGLGYSGGVASLGLAVLVIGLTDRKYLPFDVHEGEHIRLLCIIVALWYACLAVPLFFWTPDAVRTGQTLRQSAAEGVHQLYITIRSVRHTGPIIRFLIAHMIYNDALATLFVFGGTYAKGTFDMGAMQIALFGIGLATMAGIGAVAFSWIDDWMGGKRTILVSLVGLMIPSALMLLVESQAVFWVLGMTLGIFVGPAQAAGRSYLARVTPQPLHNQMFGLYALSGKATSFLGPLVVAEVTLRMGSQRVGMAVISLLFLIGFLVMLTVVRDQPGKVAPASEAPV